MKFIQLVFGLIYITSHVKVSSCLEWILNDAVHLSAEIETRSPEESEPILRLPGKCVKLRECYPILFLTDRGDKDGSTSINSDLIQYILETSDTCKPLGYQVTASNFTEPGDLYIWCRLRLHKDSVASSAPNISPGKPLSVTAGIKAEDDNSLCTQTLSPNARIDTPAERVVGGTELAKGDAPYIVAIIFRGKQVCGGSIIDEQHVLTAAHCVSHLKPTVLSHLRLLIGDHDIKTIVDTHHQERNVSKIIYHKEFSSDTLHDDIAMIKVSEPIQFSSSVSPICLHDGLTPVDEGTTYGRLVGWGQVEDGGERTATPREASLRIWRSDECEEVYDGIVPEDIFEKVVCAGGFQDGGTTDACRGDSGGPLSVVQNKRHWQVGLVSFGIGCGRYPGVFTKVSEYQSWIDRHRTIVLSNE